MKRHGRNLPPSGGRGSQWLECFADNPGAEHGDAFAVVDPGDRWDVLAAKVAAHELERGGAPAAGAADGPVPA
jgi:hypothetical protein